MLRVLFEVPDPPPAQLRLEGARHHHLVHVLRARPGEVLEVFDGRGHVFTARLESLGAESAVLELGPSRASAARRPITLVQGLPKGDKLEEVLQHGTELGATCFQPAATTHSVVQLSEERAAKKLERWRRIVEEAARQCGRADVPEVLAPKPLLEAVGTLPSGTKVLVLDEAERSTKLSDAFQAVRTAGAPLALVVGPEGGLSDDERSALVALGATPVSLGQRVLRTETASLAALAVLLHLDGELG